MNTTTQDRAIRSRTAPGPEGYFSRLAEYKRDPVSTLLRLRNEYGDLVLNRMGPYKTFLVAHPEHIQQILIDNHRNYGRGRFYDDFRLFFGEGLLTTDGDQWRRHRRAVQPLFHKKVVDEGASLVAEVGGELLNYWRKMESGTVIDVVEEMMHLSLNLLGRTVFGIDISHHSRRVDLSASIGMAAMMRQGNINDLIPRWLPTPFNRRVAWARRELNAVITEIIQAER